MESEHIIIYKDMGKYVFEWCQSHSNCHQKRIYGKKAREIQKQLEKYVD